MGKREEKKKLFKDKIMTAAREVFHEHGYDNTTMEMISTKAEVGLGTAYVYFKSKSELYRETFLSDIHIDKLGDLLKDVDMSVVPHEQVHLLLKGQLEIVAVWNKSLIIEYIIAYLKELNRDNLLIALMEEVDGKVQNQIVSILQEYQTNGAFLKNFNPSLAGEMLTCLLIEFIYKIITTEEFPLEQMSLVLKEKVNYLLCPYECLAC